MGYSGNGEIDDKEVRRAQLRRVGGNVAYALSNIYICRNCGSTYANARNNTWRKPVFWAGWNTTIVSVERRLPSGASKPVSLFI